MERKNLAGNRWSGCHRSAEFKNRKLVELWSRPSQYCRLLCRQRRSQQVTPERLLKHLCWISYELTNVTTQQRNPYLRWLFFTRDQKPCFYIASPISFTVGICFLSRECFARWGDSLQELKFTPAPKSEIDSLLIMVWGLS